jgi:hypothetical protein
MDKIERLKLEYNENHVKCKLKRTFKAINDRVKSIEKEVSRY